MYTCREGGLWLRRLNECNKAAMMICMRNLFVKSGTISVAWENHYLQGRSFWADGVPQDCTWGWKKILCIRKQSRPLIKLDVGIGEMFSYNPMA